MTASLFFIQLLNGLQLGVLLFMLSAGLTLVFGIMSFVNLAHGCLYMMGACLQPPCTAPPSPLWPAGAAAVVGGGVLAAVVERVVARPLLHARPPGPRSGHLRPDLVFQRARRGGFGAPHRCT